MHQSFYSIEYVFCMLFDCFLLIHFHLSLQISIQNYMLKQQFVLHEYTFSKFWEFLFVFFLQRIDVIHKFQFFQIKWSILSILLEEDNFLVFEFFVLRNVFLNQIVKRTDIVSSERYFEVSFMPF